MNSLDRNWVDQKKTENTEVYEGVGSSILFQIPLSLAFISINISMSIVPLGSGLGTIEPASDSRTTASSNSLRPFFRLLTA